MPGLLRRALHPLGPVGAQAMAQAMSLGLQLVLIALIGQELFSSLALGLLAANSAVFLGEAGFGTFFLREAARNPDWESLWRASSLTRLGVLVCAIGLSVAALQWGAPMPDAALQVMAAASPGILFSAFNPAPVLFGTGRVRLASGSVLSRFAVQASVGVAVAAVLPERVALGLGVGFSLGLLVQVLFGLAAGLSPRLFVPRLTLFFPSSAVFLWALAVVSTVNDRLLAFLAGNASPVGLAFLLILIQFLQVSTGLGAQLDRVLVPATAKGGTTKGGRAVDVLRALKRPVLGIIVGVWGSVLGVVAVLHADLLPIVALLLVEWSMVVMTAIGFPVAFATGRERPVVYFLLIAVPLSVIGQVVAIEVASIEVAIALRIAVVLMAAFILLKCILDNEEKRH